MNWFRVKLGSNSIYFLGKEIDYFFIFKNKITVFLEMFLGTKSNLSLEPLKRLGIQYVYMQQKIQIIIIIIILQNLI